MVSLTYGFVSLAQLTDLVRRNLPRIPRDIDLVVGIPRSGMMPAYAIGLYLNLAVIDLPAFTENRRPAHGRTRLLARETPAPLSARRILLVDDSCLYGDTMRAAVAAIRAAGFSGGIVTCAAIVEPAAKENVDIHFMEMPSPRIFEWNLFHHAALAQACLDLDGVLCVDPTESENDDGPAYGEFLENTLPLYLPSVPIGHIVSARLEKYRGPTEAWLARHGVRYQRLHLLDLPSKAERIRTGAHTGHKARVYRETQAPLFIESDDGQAASIAQQTGRPVLSIATMQVHCGTGLYLRNLAPVASNLGWQARLGLKKYLKRTLPPFVIENAKKARRGLNALVKRA